jgi:hypothetical protein
MIGIEASKIFLFRGVKNLRKTLLDLVSRPRRCTLGPQSIGRNGAPFEGKDYCERGNFPEVR